MDADESLPGASRESSRLRKKTGPSPKYGPDQAKKMVSMRLSPDALQSIKEAAEKVFRDSQADVIEKVMRLFPAEMLVKISELAKKHDMSPSQILAESLQAFEERKSQQHVAS